MESDSCVIGATETNQEKNQRLIVFPTNAFGMMLEYQEGEKETDLSD